MPTAMDVGPEREILPPSVGNASIGSAIYHHLVRGSPWNAAPASPFSGFLGDVNPGLAALTAPVDIATASRFAKICADADRFALQLKHLESRGIDAFPVWRYGGESGQIVPIDLTNPANFADLDVLDVDAPLSVETLLERWAAYDRDAPDGGGPGFAGLDQTAKAFAETMGDNLQGLIAAAPTVVRPYRVNSQNTGFQIHWTEQYWKSPAVFGAGLSFPVDGYLNDGKYRFGGSKPPHPGIVWDGGIHEVSATRRETTLIAI